MEVGVRAILMAPPVCTEILAEIAALLLVPCAVVIAPAAMVLVLLALRAAFALLGATEIVTVQEPLAGTVPPESRMPVSPPPSAPPAGSVNVPPAQVVEAAGEL